MLNICSVQCFNFVIVFQFGKCTSNKKKQLHVHLPLEPVHPPYSSNEVLKT